jgi:bifunctional NMN adenylyltransferase/nudix hydrolase
MKKASDTVSDVGVLVGRFQVHELHKAHLDLIQHVSSQHQKVLVFLGLSPAKVTKVNPLDFEARKQMILERFPEVNVLYIKDNPSDEKWSENLDEQIKDLVGPSQSVTLYGSRDSFISHYHGSFSTTELLQEVYISGTEIRNSIGKKVKNTPEFRAGVIWATGNQYPKVWPTVDIAIISEDRKRMLMARKVNEDKYRFVGGFATTNSVNYEEDAKREVLEETGIEVGEMEYVGSFNVNDWRYRGEHDKIKTILYMTTYVFGRPEANDDICEIKWFDISSIKITDVVDTHKCLLEAALKKLGKSKK